MVPLEFQGKEEEESPTVKSFTEIKWDMNKTLDTGFSNREALVTSSSDGCERRSRTGRGMGGCGEKMEVDISSRNLTLKGPNGVKAQQGPQRGHFFL